MGAWGTKPYENDKSSDWLFSLWKKFPLQLEIASSLEMNVEDYHEEIRIAAFILSQMAYLSAWDLEELESLFQIALEKLALISNMEIYQEVDFQREIESEIFRLSGELELLRGNA